MNKKSSQQKKNDTEQKNDDDKKTLPGNNPNRTHNIKKESMGPNTKR